MIFSVWIYGFLMTITVIVYSNEYGYNRNTGMCDFLDESLDPATIVKILIWLVGFFLPLSIMVISYIIIWRTIRKSTSYLRENTE